jgi:hypothetical protein
LRFLSRLTSAMVDPLADRASKAPFPRGQQVAERVQPAGERRAPACETVNSLDRISAGVNKETGNTSSSFRKRGDK